MITSLHNIIIFEDDEMKRIEENLKKYNKFFKSVIDSPIGQYSIINILETIEEVLNYLEIYSPVTKEWLEQYLNKNRGELWLFYGIMKGSDHADYWKIKETDYSELESTWPFLFKDNIKYKDFIVVLRGAQREILRQRERQNTSNPNYKPFHPDGCSGCSCWMLDDMEQWYTEEQEEIKQSRNIFFNGQLQNDFYKTALEDLGEIKEQWGTWMPYKSVQKTPDNTFNISNGETPIKLVINWIKKDFYYSSIFSMFDWSNKFKNAWENIDSVDDFIKCERAKLKKIVNLL